MLRYVVFWIRYDYYIYELWFFFKIKLVKNFRVYGGGFFEVLDLFKELVVVDYCWE